VISVLMSHILTHTHTSCLTVDLYWHSSSYLLLNVFQLVTVVWCVCSGAEVFPGVKFQQEENTDSLGSGGDLPAASWEMWLCVSVQTTAMNTHTHTHTHTHTPSLHFIQTYIFRSYLHINTKPFHNTRHTHSALGDFNM